ncbi:putative C2H2 transcription factor [Aspergillus mulundensis]|uniref:C2H2-type domain-containing protein n=1 Tax=Aspergillus mulundensis TaxID=1810919 RepID=A0A3D8R9U0_9EURO|nr:hypothetical protein DSM5745_08333 [Aspergillus mulundensis]RDW70822.1 hypothetical protein DSM5745_08333 [Aspergillus mulundensis]
MEDNRARRQGYPEPYTTTMEHPLILAPDNTMFYASPGSFAPLPNHAVSVPDEYLSYGTSSQLDPTASYYPASQPQPYVQQNPYYPATTMSQTPSNSNSNSNSNTQWLHPPQASSHYHPQTYQDSIPSSDIDPDFDLDLDVDVDQGPFSSPSPSYHNHNPYAPTSSDPTQTQLNQQVPTRTPSTTSASSTNANASNSKDLSLYGTPSPTHPGAWRCAYPSCTSSSLFRRGCDLRKHYNRHRKHLFCRHDGCPQSNPQMPGAGFSSKKDRDRHEAKHNPGIVCEWASEGCTRVFSRVDNMKDHVRRIHKGV